MSILFVVTAAGLLTSEPGLADGAVEWSAPVNISQSGRAGIPLMAVSSDGVVHVVWGEPRGSSTSRAADTIMYSRLSQNGWSRPIDILAVAVGDAAVPEALEYDRYGQLVLVWRTNSDLRLSAASSEAAGGASGWLTSVIEANRASLSAALTVGDDGAYHLAFVRSNREIVYMASTDGGGSWHSETIIERVMTSGLAVSIPCIAVNNRGGRFVAWATNKEATNWAAAGVWFSHSTDDGKTWSAPRVVSDEPGHGAPSLLYDASDQLRLAWVGNLDAGGRYQAVSHDDGASFGAAATMASPQQLRGYAGAVRLLQDSTGALHALFGGLGLGQLDSIWYVAETGGVWTAPARVSPGLKDSQETRARIGEGHWLHAVWIENSTHDVWYASADTGAPAVAPPSLATLPDAVRPRESGAVGTGSGSVPVSGGSVTPSGSASWEGIGETIAPTGYTLALGVMPATILLAAVILWQRRRENR